MGDSDPWEILGTDRRVNAGFSSSHTSVRPHLAPRRARTARLSSLSSLPSRSSENNGRARSLQIPHSRGSRLDRRCLLAVPFATPSSVTVSAERADAGRREAQARRGIHQCRRDPCEQASGERSVAPAGEQAAFWSPREHPVPWCVASFFFSLSCFVANGARHC